jgi:hypothetical protein
MLIQQRIELGTQRAEAADLHLDELSTRADDIDHELTDRHLQSVTRPRQPRFQRGMQLPLAQYADARHAAQASGGGGIKANDGSQHAGHAV